MKKKFGLLALTGVIALASCSQGTGNPAATTYKLTINVSGPASAQATISGATTTTVTVPTTQTLASGSYTVAALPVTGYTAPANQTVDLTSDKTITLTYTGGPIVTPPPAGTGPTITIVSPTNGASLPGATATQVNFTTTGTLTGVTCSVNGGTASPASLSATGGFCTVTTSATGASLITVSGKDSAGATVTTSVTVTAPTAPASFPPGISFKDSERLTLNADGTVNDSANDVKDITARVYTNNGWRQLSQGLSTGGAPTSDLYTYVKGTVNVVYTAPTGSAPISKVEVLLARTTGSDVPTNDDIQSADVLNVAVNPTGAVTTSFDSTKLGEFQAVPEWLVFRVTNADGTSSVSFVRVVADNTAPQPARADFEGAKATGSNVIRNFRGIQNNNFARGKIDVFTTNRDLQDQPFGRAPVTSTVPQRRPAGFESIRYFLVPSALVDQSSDVGPGLRDSDGVRVAKTIRFAFNTGLGVIASAPQLAIGAAGDFRTMFNSTKATTCTAGAPVITPSTAGSITTDPATTIAPEGKYRLYALTRDQLGNETASPDYQVVTFDNVGPNVSGAAVRDSSPLPFPSTSPFKYISDVAAIGGNGKNSGQITDAGIGFDTSAPFHVDIGSLKIAVGAVGGATVNGLLNTITIPATSFDTNPIGDGVQTVSYNSFADALGNLPTNCAPASVTIDNTDPTVSFNRFTANGIVESGSPQSIETLASDSTSGVYANILFWNDYASFANNNQERAGRTRGNGFVGAPVEIQRVYKGLELTDGDGSQTNVGNNATWNALYPTVRDSGIQSMNINVVVSDRAGNATVLTRGVQVIPRTTNTVTTGGLGGGVGLPIPFNIPVLGQSDGYRFDRAANLGNNPGRAITPVNTNNTTLADAGKPLDFPIPGATLPSEDAVLSLAVSGTATNNGFIVTTTGGTSTGFDKVNNVTGFGGYNRTDWGKVLTYLNSKPSTATINTFQLGDPSLVRQNGSQAIVFDSNLFQVRADSRNLNDGFFANDNSASATPVTVLTAAGIPTAAPWLKLGDLSTANQFYKVNSDLLNNLFWTRGYDASTYDYLNVDGINDATDANQVPLIGVYDEITGVVTDTAGAYNFYGEKTGR